MQEHFERLFYFGNESFRSIETLRSKNQKNDLHRA